MLLGTDCERRRPTPPENLVNKCSWSRSSPNIRPCGMSLTILNLWMMQSIWQRNTYNICIYKPKKHKSHDICFMQQTVHCTTGQQMPGVESVVGVCMLPYLSLFLLPSFHHYAIKGSWDGTLGRPVCRNLGHI